MNVVSSSSAESKYRAMANSVCEKNVDPSPHA